MERPRPHSWLLGYVLIVHQGTKEAPLGCCSWETKVKGLLHDRTSEPIIMIVLYHGHIYIVNISGAARETKNLVRQETFA